MTTFRRTEAGLTIQGTGTFGVRASTGILDRTPQTVTGSMQTMGGHGSQITIGAGRPFTTGAGYTMIIMDGFGYLAMIGRPRGLHGAL